MKWFLPIFMLTTSFITFADVSPQDVEKMLGQMVRENVISREEAEKAKFRMKSISPAQWAQINQHAAKIAARSPASATPSQNKIEEVHGIDLDGAQFKQIQDEMKKIVPQYKD
jgi:hypothetical protein